MKLLAKKNWENGIMYTTPQPMRTVHVEKYANRMVYKCEECNALMTSIEAMLQHCAKEHPRETARYFRLNRSRLVKRALLETETKG